MALAEAAEAAGVLLLDQAAEAVDLLLDRAAGPEHLDLVSQLLGPIIQLWDRLVSINQLPDHLSLLLLDPYRLEASLSRDRSLLASVSVEAFGQGSVLLERLLLVTRSIQLSLGQPLHTILRILEDVMADTTGDTVEDTLRVSSSILPAIIRMLVLLFSIRL